MITTHKEGCGHRYDVKYFNIGRLLLVISYFIFSTEHLKSYMQKDFLNRL